MNKKVYFFYNERNVNQWKKKCEHLFGKRGKMFREVEMENFGQQNVINDTVIIKKGTLKNFTINVHRLTLVQSSHKQKTVEQVSISNCNPERNVLLMFTDNREKL